MQAELTLQCCACRVIAVSHVLHGSSLCLCSPVMQVDIINSTLGKALGGATGGYTTGRSDVVALLRQKSRPYLFSNTLAPSVAAASIEVFNMLASDSSLKQKLDHNTSLFRGAMTDAGFALGDSKHPIVVCL